MVLFDVFEGTRRKVLSLVVSRGNCVWQRALLTHMAQASVPSSHRRVLASWALIFRSWYPDATAAHLGQHTFLLMYPSGILLDC